MKKTKWLLGLLFILLSTTAFAADPFPGLMQQFETMSRSINQNLVQPGLILAGSVLLFQWTVTHAKEIFTGELTSVFAKAVGILSWFGFSVWLLQNQELFATAFNKYMSLAISLSGTSGQTVSMEPGDILLNGIVTILKTNFAVTTALGKGIVTAAASGSISDTASAVVNALNPFNNIGAQLMILVSDFFIFMCFLFLALAVFVARIEFWLMFAVAPLMVPLAVSGAFRDQGLAPIKGLISLGLRLIILGLIVAIADSFSLTLLTYLENGLPADGNLFGPVWIYMAGMAATAMAAISAGKIASAIASGSASFSGADAIKGGMQLASAAAPVAAGAAAGVAAGAAMAGGVKSALGSVAEAIRSRGDLGVSLPKNGPDGSSSGGAQYSKTAGASSEGASSAQKAMEAFGGPLPTSSSDQKSGGTKSGSSASQSGGDAKTGGSSNAKTSGDAKAEGASNVKASGDASSASIGGANSGNNNQSNEPSRLRKFGDALHNAGEQTAQDNHAVSISINSRAD